MYKIYTHKRGMPIRRLHKILRVMKLTIIILIAAMMQVSAATYAQRITLKEKDASLETVFKEIRKQSGYDFYFDQNVISKGSLVTLDLKDASLDEALKSCLAGQPLTYTVEEKTIVIKEKEPTILDKLKKALTPPSDIIGRVTNTHGQPLNGATVTIKRTQTGTLTDANGNFTIRDVLPTDTLVFSYLGYKRQFIRVGEQKDLKIVLEEATNNLDQVVIQAYGETSQRTTTGNIGTVTAAQIEKQPVMNVLQALQGQIPGVVVTNTSGYTSGVVKVEVRGRNTINPNFPSDPLYVIDGVPLTILNVTGQSNYHSGDQGVVQSGIQGPAGGPSPFFGINPSDIESISVLKDADATAIYGSRGANGVILVTTKKGKSGKAKFETKISQGIAEASAFYNMMNTKQYVSMRKEALANDGIPININTAPDLVKWDTTRYTDWQKYLWGGLGKATDIQTSLSGGDNQTTFRLSGGYHNQTEISTLHGANTRGSVSFNINHKSINQKLSLMFTGNYSIAQSDQIFNPAYITLAPDAPAIYDNKGNLNYAGWAPLDSAFPFGHLLQPYTTKTNTLNSNLVVSYELFKNLIFKTSLGYNNFQTTQTNFTPIASQNPAYDPTGSSGFGYTFVHNTIIEPQFEYNKTISKGKLNVLLGGSYQQNQTTGVSISGYGYTNDALLSTINSAPIQSTSQYVGDYKYDAIFGRINYNWEDKYIVDFNDRRDGSSRFGPGREFGNFASIGAAWIFSEEKWVKDNLTFLSFGKLRGSYGTTGGDHIGDYAYLSQWSFSRYGYNQVQPLTPINHTDSTLHWQVNKKLEAAFDVGFLKDRLTFEVAWYRDRTNDQLVQFPTPVFTGFGFVTSNSPAEVQNSGFEFLLAGKLVDNENFKWNASFNLGLNRNKLLAYPNLSQSPYNELFEIGQPLNIVKVLHYTGVDPLTGQYTFKDKNHDGQITVAYGSNNDDRSPIDLSPKFDGSFTNTFFYKNFQLTAMFYFRKQIGINAYANVDFPGDMTNQPIEVLNRWQQPGDVGKSFAKFTTNPYSNNSYSYFQSFSDGIFTDASFIRLQNLSIAYMLSDKLVKKLGISGCKIYLESHNIFTITKYAGLDPEVQSLGLPTPRIIILGLTCNI